MNDSKKRSEVRNIGNHRGDEVLLNIRALWKGAQEYSFITNNTNFAENGEDCENDESAERDHADEWFYITSLALTLSLDILKSVRKGVSIDDSEITSF